MPSSIQETGIGSGRLRNASDAIKPILGSLIGPILSSMMRFALAHPEVKARALALVCRSPALQSWLVKFAASRRIAAGSTFVHIYPDYTRQTPNSLRIYSDLKALIDEKRKEP